MVVSACAGTDVNSLVWEAKQNTSKQHKIKGCEDICWLQLNSKGRPNAIMRFHLLWQLCYTRATSSWPCLHLGDKRQVKNVHHATVEHSACGTVI